MYLYLDCFKGLLCSSGVADRRKEGKKEGSGGGREEYSLNRDKNDPCLGIPGFLLLLLLFLFH